MHNHDDTASDTTFTSTARRVRAGDHPHLLAALREELDVTSPKDGCSPSGQCGCCTVLVDGKAVVSCKLAAGQGGRQGGRHARGRRRRRAPRASPTRSPPAAACSAASASPASSMRAKAQIDKKGADLDRAVDGAAPRRPPVPLHRLRQDPRRHRGRGQGQVVRAGAARRASVSRAPSTRRPSWRSATAATSTTSACPACCTPRSTSPTTPAPTSRRSTRRRPLAAPGVVGVFTAADIPGELRVGIIYKDWPVHDPRSAGARRTPATCWPIVVAETRQQARAAAELVEVDYDVLPPVTDPLAAVEPGAELAVWGTDDNVLSRSALRPRRRRRRRSPPAPTPSTRCSRPSASSTPSWSRSRRSPSRPDRRRRAHDARVLRRAGRVGRPRRHLPRARRRRPIRWPSSWCRTAAPSAARRT